MIANKSVEEKMDIIPAVNSFSASLTPSNNAVVNDIIPTIIPKRTEID